MAWQISGEMLDTCSCNIVCPCVFGPAKPDQEWCSFALVWDIQQGNSDGVNLGGTRVALSAELPGDFLSGNGTGRLYVADDASEEQRRELEAIFSGEKGGAFSALGGILTKVLPTQVTNITITRGENPSVRVGNVGEINLQRVKTESGKQARLSDAPLLEAFGVESDDLARGDGSRWSDSEMRNWESGGHGGVSRFSLSA